MHTVETNIQWNKRIVKVIDLTFRSLLWIGSFSNDDRNGKENVIWK